MAATVSLSRVDGSAVLELCSSRAVVVVVRVSWEGLLG
jgi:hypothetical protein